MITRIEVIRHVLTFAVVFGGALFALSRFEWFRQVGVILLASAGIAGLVLGIAGQRLLGNLFAGLLLAMTQPVKSGDAVIFGKRVRLGGGDHTDLPRHPDLGPASPRGADRLLPRQAGPELVAQVQHLMMPLMIHADYGIDVEAVRGEFHRIMEESEEWDRDVPPILQVTDCTEESIVLRALCELARPDFELEPAMSGTPALVAFIQGLEGGRHLPRRRVLLVGDDHQDPESNGEHRFGAAAESVEGRRDRGP